MKERNRCNLPCLFAMGMLTLAFLVDTATTLAGGVELRATDINPFVRGLPDSRYLIWSAARWGTALALLWFFWPRQLTRHTGGNAVQYVRDEAHRFAQHYHHNLMRKRTFDDA